MTAPTNRAVRLNRILELLKGRPSGFTARELAEITGVNVRTIQRDILTLQTDMHTPLMEDHGRYSLMKETRLSPVELSIHEARALMIAARLFLRHSDEGDPFAVTALQTLARAMPDPVRKQMTAAADAIARRDINTAFARTLVTVTEAWARRRALKLSYRSAGKSRPREVIVEPYFLEPSAAGYATYLIGYSRTHSMMRTFKVERIISAEMLPQAFEIPDALELDGLLSSAWGIIWGEGKQVQLRFKPDVAWRVKESRWHPSQTVEDLQDGSCLLTMTVASMMELGRWVRSWGDKVEVLAPAELREELREEAVRLARTYTQQPKRIARPKRAAASADGKSARPGSVA